MNYTRANYHGKILLFGEYSILYGSGAAIIPFRKTKAGFVSGECNSESNRVLSDFLEFLKDAAFGDSRVSLTEYIDTEKFRTDIKLGLAFESDIPRNKGLGSSGALCAGVYDRYGKQKASDPSELRGIFSAIESWFHGKSSGIDPLCIYLDKSVIILDEEYHISDDRQVLSRNALKPFLIDMGSGSKTLSGILSFSEMMKQKYFEDEFRSKYIPQVNKCVDQWKEGLLQRDTIFDLSDLQLYFFSELISKELKTIWEKGFESNLYAMKICGSGGGMVLGFTRNQNDTVHFLKEHFAIEPIIVDTEV